MKRVEMRSEDEQREQELQSLVFVAQSSNDMMSVCHDITPSRHICDVVTGLRHGTIRTLTSKPEKETKTIDTEIDRYRGPIYGENGDFRRISRIRQNQGRCIGSRIGAFNRCRNQRPWMTLNGHCAICTLLRNVCVFWSPPRKFEQRPVLSAT